MAYVFEKPKPDVYGGMGIRLLIISREQLRRV
jgi:hypothetical protein